MPTSNEGLPSKAYRMRRLNGINWVMQESFSLKPDRSFTTFIECQVIWLIVAGTVREQNCFGRLFGFLQNQILGTKNTIEYRQIPVQNSWAINLQAPNSAREIIAYSVQKIMDRELWYNESTSPWLSLITARACKENLDTLFSSFKYLAIYIIFPEFGTCTL